MRWFNFKKKKEKATEYVESAVTPESQTKLVPLHILYDEIKSKHNSILDTEDIYNTELKELMKKYKCGYREDDPQNNKRLCIDCVKSLRRSVLLIPFSYDDKTFPSAKEIHLTRSSAERINENSIVYCAERMTVDQLRKLYWVLDENNKPTFDDSWWNISRFAGSEGYSFATKGSESPKVMVPYTFNTTDGEFVIPGYTGLDTLTQSMKSLGIVDGYGIAAYTLEDYVHSFQRVTDLTELIVDIECPETYCRFSSSLLCNIIRELNDS